MFVQLAGFFGLKKGKKEKAAAAVQEPDELLPEQTLPEAVEPELRDKFGSMLNPEWSSFLIREDKTGSKKRETIGAAKQQFSMIYKLGDKLGEGNYATVMQGTNKTTGEVFAIKMVDRKKLSKVDEEALRDEIRIQKELNHEHIVRLYETYEQPATYNLVLEIVAGGELFDRVVEKEYYTEKEARDLLKIIFDAMSYCHEHQVAHRDLKPENLLLKSHDDDTAIKIADFGFAKKVLEPCSLATQCGTPAYVAPEILNGDPYDQRSDNWSLGVIAYILLGGYPPFREKDLRDLFFKIRKGDYEFHDEFWSEVSQDAKDFISSLLTVDYEKRCTAQQALQAKWIVGDDSSLSQRNLQLSLEQFKKFNARRKFKGAVKTIIASNKLTSLGEDFRKHL